MARRGFGMMLEIVSAVPGAGLETVEVTIRNKRYVMPARYEIYAAVTGSKGGAVIGESRFKGEETIPGGGKITKRLLITYTEAGAERAAGLWGPTLLLVKVTLMATRLDFVQDEKSFTVLIQARIPGKPPPKPGPGKGKISLADEKEKADIRQKIYQETGKMPPKAFIAYILEQEER